MPMVYANLYSIEKPWRPCWMGGYVLRHCIRSIDDPYVSFKKIYTHVGSFSGVEVKPSPTIKKWFRDNNIKFAMTEGDYRNHNRQSERPSVIYYFEKKDDALLFKLVWG